MSTLVAQKSKVKVAKSTTRKNPIINLRFTLTPGINTIMQDLEKRYLGLDRSEIVKLALNNLYQQEPSFFGGASSNAFADSDAALTWLSKDKTLYRD